VVEAVELLVPAVEMGVVVVEAVELLVPTVEIVVLELSVARLAEKLSVVFTVTTTMIMMIIELTTVPLETELLPDELPTDIRWPVSCGRTPRA
jgi:hypothetical protein